MKKQKYETRSNWDVFWRKTKQIYPAKAGKKKLDERKQMKKGKTWRNLRTVKTTRQSHFKSSECFLRRWDNEKLISGIFKRKKIRRLWEKYLNMLLKLYVKIKASRLLATDVLTLRDMVLRSILSLTWQHTSGRDCQHHTRPPFHPWYSVLQLDDQWSYRMMW